MLDGRYRIVEQLGEGGMGVVFKAEHVRLGKLCAVKLLRPEIARNTKAIRRFHQEARVISRLSSPNTVQIFDFGELPDGTLYIAMELLSGQDARLLLREHGALPERAVVDIGIQILGSLAEAHEQGVIHRDLKPENVFVVQRRGAMDVAKLLDFGIAKLFESGDVHVTGTDFLGTPAYVSPEQARGEALTRASDLYSLGAVLFELAAGRPPFEAAAPIAVVIKHLNDPPPRFSAFPRGKTLSPGFELIIRKALSKAPSDRFASAEEMRGALERLKTEATATLPAAPMAEEVAAVSKDEFDLFERNLRLRRKLLPMLALSLLALAVTQLVQYVGSPPRAVAPPVALPTTSTKPPVDCSGEVRLVDTDHPLGVTPAAQTNGESARWMDCFGSGPVTANELGAVAVGLPGFSIQVIDLAQRDRPPRLDAGGSAEHLHVVSLKARPSGFSAAVLHSGQPYFLAFFSRLDGGHRAVQELARTLRAAGRSADAAELLRRTDAPEARLQPPADPVLTKTWNELRRRAERLKDGGVTPTARETETPTKKVTPTVTPTDADSADAAAVAP